MASPLRSWSPPRPDRSGGAGRPTATGRRRRGRAAVEPLEGRQLFAASLVSIDSTGLSSGNDTALDPDISSTGRFVVFTSQATDLVAEDTNTTFDVYLRDLQTGVTRLVSVASTGTGPGNSSSTDPSVSDDGRYVVFTSNASNLVEGDANSASDVFVRDMVTNETRLVSMNLAGTGAANGASLQGSISDNGRFVAFSSDATNLTSFDASPTRDVFLRDLQNNTTTLVSSTLVGGTGPGGNGASESPSISSSGQYVAFVSAATDLPGGLAPGAGLNVYLYDTDVNVDAPPEPGDPPPVPTLTLISTTGVAGTGGGAVLGTGAPTVSDDGRFVAYTSTAADLVPGDVNGVADVFRKDVPSGTNQLVSQNTIGEFSNGASARPKISSTGQYVAFSSTGSNLAAPDNGPGTDVFVRDVDGAVTYLVSANQTNTGGTGGSAEPAISDDGRIVAFSSSANNLVPEPVQDTQVYVGTTPLLTADTTRPVFSVPAQPPGPNTPQVGGTVIPFAVLYEDNDFIDTATLGDLDLVVTGPNGYSEEAEFLFLQSNSGVVATVYYTVPAPDGQLSSADNGTYTVTVRGNQIADRSRNFVAAGGTGSIVLNLPPSETVLPQPTFTGGSPAVGDSTYEFTVTYEERGGINFATFGNDDVVVTGPASFSQNATFVSSTELSATTTAVVYRITAPGGTWDASDAGAYTVGVLPGGVLDLGGNAVQAGAFGQFTALGADLIAIPLRNLRSGAISGVDQQRARIRILNQGSFPTTVPVAVTLYTSLDETLDPGDATIGTFINERPIGADDFNEVRVRFTYPQVPEGDYFVLSQVDSGNAVLEQSETNNVAASFRKVGLSEPFVDLVPTLVPFAGIRSRLGTNEATIRIRNAGNVTVSQDIVVGLTAVSDVTPTPGESPVANVTVRVQLKPGQSRQYRLPFTFPLEFERGTYRLVATVDSTNLVAERDEANNRVQSLSSFTFA